MYKTIYLADEPKSKQGRKKNPVHRYDIYHDERENRNKNNRR